jgi:HEAT repeat protein
MTEPLDQELRALVRSRRVKDRLQAVAQLRGVDGSHAIPALIGLLYDGRSNVADAAADALRGGFGSAGRTAMMRVLHEDHEWARLAVARSLAADGDPVAMPVLDEALRGPDLDQWGPALERLVRFGADARPLIERELMDRNGPPMMREMCAPALVEVSGDDARPLLEEVARSAPHVVRVAALRSLRTLDERAARGAGGS